MPIDQTECLTRLAEARAALHQLMLGRSAKAITDQNGDKVEFTQTNKADLIAYIQSLEAQCGSGAGCCGASNGPLQFTF